MSNETSASASEFTCPNIMWYRGAPLSSETTPSVPNTSPAERLRDSVERVSFFYFICLSSRAVRVPAVEIN